MELLKSEISAEAEMNSASQFNIEFVSPSSEGNASSAIVILPDVAIDEAGANQLSASITSEFKPYILSSSLPAAEAVLEFSADMEGALLQHGVKRMTLFGIGRGANVALAAAAVTLSRHVRRIVLLDGTARMAPGFLTRAVDGLERFLPLGLPMRSLDRQFDARPFLHRIYCPSLVLTSPSASSYIKEQSAQLAQRIPNAWEQKLSAPAFGKDGRLSSELSALLHEFAQIPVKRPQKNAGTEDE